MKTSKKVPGHEFLQTPNGPVAVPFDQLPLLVVETVVDPDDPEAGGFGGSTVVGGVLQKNTLAG